MGGRQSEKKPYCFAWILKENGCVGVLRKDGLLASIQEPYENDGMRDLSRWWSNDERGARRCLATGPAVGLGVPARQGPEASAKSLRRAPALKRRAVR